MDRKTSNPSDIASATPLVRRDPIKANPAERRGRKATRLPPDLYRARLVEPPNIPPREIHALPTVAGEGRLDAVGVCPPNPPKLR